MICNVGEEFKISLLPLQDTLKQWVGLQIPQRTEQSYRGENDSPSLQMKVATPSITKVSLNRGTKPFAGMSTILSITAPLRRSKVVISIRLLMLSPKVSRTLSRLAEIAEYDGPPLPAGLGPCIFFLLAGLIEGSETLLCFFFLSSGTSSSFSPGPVLLGSAW